MRKKSASSSWRQGNTCNQVYKMFYMSVRIGWKQRAVVILMKLSNANPVSTWMGERLTLPGAVDYQCIFVSH